MSEIKNDVIEKQYEELKNGIKFRIENNISDDWEQHYHCIDVLCEKHKERIQDIENGICVIEKLKQQLAEKDQAIESLEELNRSLGQTCNNDKKEIERLNKLLAEKEKELHYKTTECEKWQRDYKNCSELEKIMSKEHQYCLDNWRASEQDKISFAVEKLENIKNAFDLIIAHNPRLNKCEITKEYIYYIDNQIKQLKEGK